MNKKERQSFVYQEIEAIYHEMDNSISQLVLLKGFLQKIIEISKGAEPAYDNLGEIRTSKITPVP